MDAGRGIFRRGRRSKNFENEVDVDEQRRWNNRYETVVNDDKYDISDDDLDVDDVDSDTEQFFVEENARRNIQMNPSYQAQGMKIRRRDYENLDVAGRHRGGNCRQYDGSRYEARKRPTGVGNDFRSQVIDFRRQGLEKHRGRRVDDRDMYGRTSYGFQPDGESFEDEFNDELEDTEATLGGITYLSNVQTVVKTIRSLPLTEEHLEFIKKTPFWWFVKAALDMNDAKVSKQFRKNNYIITKILKRFHREGRKLGFKFGEVFPVPNRDEFVLIFGLKCGRRVVCPGGGTVKVTNFLQRCFPGKLEHMAAADGTQYKMTTTLLLDALTAKITGGEPDVGKDIGRLMHLFLLASFFMPNRGLCLSWRLTETIDKFEDMCEYDWGSFVFDDLMQDINNNRKLKIGGCSIFLLFWLCERTFVVSPVRGCQQFPRFLKCDLFSMGKVMIKMDFDNLTRYTDVKRKMTLTEEEVDLLGLQCDITDDEEEDCFILDKKEAVRMAANDKGKAKVSDFQIHGEYGVPLRKRVKSESMSSHETTSFEELMSSAPEPPSFDLLDQREENEGGLLRKDKSDKSVVNKVKWSNPLVNDVRLSGSRNTLVDGGRNLFPDVNGDSVKGSDTQIKELELELENAKATIEALKKDMEIKEIATMAVADVIVDEEIEDLKKRLAESELVRSR